MKKAAKSVSTIGGADGPTSIFLAGGREKNVFRRVKNTIRQWRYRRKRAIADRQIIPEEHSLEETVQFMKLKYHAYEADESYPLYSEKMLQLRCSILQIEKPELIGADVEVEWAGNLDDENEIHSWMEKMDKQYEEMLRKTACITQEVYPITCHLYVIELTEGTIEIEIANNLGLMGTSCSGKMKQLHTILNDIYLYYGVSREDIEKQTPRYQSLVSILLN